MNKEDNLTSERGVDYSQLRDLLKVQNWKEADAQTARVMLKVANREKESELNVESINNFPCADLCTIDQLWVKYSNGRFGFSVQKRIYQSLGGTEKYDEKIWEAFGVRTGWRKEGDWLYYRDITFSLEAPEAHLPLVEGDWIRAEWHNALCYYSSDDANLPPCYAGGSERFSSLASRLVKCNI